MLGGGWDQWGSLRARESERAGWPLFFPPYPLRLLIVGVPAENQCHAEVGEDP